MITVIGWVSAVVVLAAYWLVTNGRIVATSHAYLGLNALGAAGLALSAAAAHAWPSAAVNIIWLGIGAVPLLRVWADKRLLVVGRMSLAERATSSQR